MANYKSLKTTINANVKRNGNQEITGQILNSVLTAMVDTLGTGYSFAGVATPATNPGTPDAKVFYIANGKGSYTHFGELEVTEDEVVVLYWDSLWHKELTGIAREENLTNLEKEVATKQNTLTDTDGSYGQRVAELEKEGIASQEKLTNLGKEIATKQNALTDTDGGYGQRVAKLEKEGIASQAKLTELDEIIHGEIENIVLSPSAIGAYINPSGAGQIGTPFTANVPVDGSATSNCYKIAVKTGERYVIYGKGRNEYVPLYLLTGNGNIVLDRKDEYDSRSNPVILDITEDGYLYSNAWEPVSTDKIIKVTKVSEGLIRDVAVINDEISDIKTSVEGLDKEIYGETSKTIILESTKGRVIRKVSSA